MNLLQQLPDCLPGPAASGFALADSSPPFPVHVERHPRPDLTKLGAAPLLIEDQAWAGWVSQKMEHVRDGSAPLVADGVSQATLSLWADWVAQAFRLRVPNGPIDSHGAFPWLGGLRPSDPHEFFVALTLSLQEDFALMVPDRHGGLSAQVLSVAFPSGWDPAEKLGLSLQDIHGPVADNAALQRGTPAMAQAMSSKGPFIRHVWTLAGNSRLGRAPHNDTLADIHRLDDLWFRCERQVTIPLSGHASLFLIRVFVASYLDVVSTPERQERIIDALRAMSPATIRYKNISRAVDLILKSTHV